jgi:hypothetical protein
MTTTPNHTYRMDISGWDDDGGAPQSAEHLPHESSPPDRKTLSTSAPQSRRRADTTNPLLNPASTAGRMREDAAPSQPNELPPDPDCCATVTEADHPLGAHDRESSQPGRWD